MEQRPWWSEALFYVFVFASVLVIIASQGSFGTDDEKSKIVCVHVKGEVVAPGYYELEYGSRVKDALIFAGGETSTADLSSINIARSLVDGEEIVVPKYFVPGSENKSLLININTADMYQLCKLDGIGEALATDIINYRNENGSFKKIEDIKKVKGIGDSKFEKIKNDICVD